MSRRWPRSRSILGNRQSEASLCNLGSERREEGGGWTGAHYSMGGVHVQRCAEPNETQVTCTHTSATVRTQNRDG